MAVKLLADALIWTSVACTRSKLAASLNRAHLQYEAWLATEVHAYVKAQSRSSCLLSVDMTKM